MKNCPSCGKELYDAAQRCDGCGIKFNQEKKGGGIPDAKDVFNSNYDDYAQMLKDNISRYSNDNGDYILDFLCEFSSMKGVADLLESWLQNLEDCKDTEYCRGAVYSLVKVRDLYRYCQKLESDYKV